MWLSSKQSCRFCRSCGALLNNLMSLLHTCLIVMDFDDNNDNTKFNTAAGAILAITSATATVITTSILPILMELNNLLAARKTARIMTRHGFNVQ